MYKAEFSGKKIDDVEKELAKQGIIDVEIVKNDSKRDDGYDSELVVRADVTGNKAVLVTSKFRLSVPISEE
ncbi:MAG: hypothetical protein MR741_01925 [Clostridiales bacterium]|nr:hypothetical protein [Clostridium sp.]MCI6059427.1 hypothetical protein [Clostridiales bacterium]MDY2683744.1 hypothetical protein [Eubacteriales bacterium]MCI6183469.1 hypothetical protein [Clostridiales bacterium]MCI6214436.1 hypothetical protein [Clostridiales bacterium]